MLGAPASDVISLVRSVAWLVTESVTHGQSLSLNELLETRSELTALTLGINLANDVGNDCQTWFHDSSLSVFGSICQSV